MNYDDYEEKLDYTIYKCKICGRFYGEINDGPRDNLCCACWEKIPEVVENKGLKEQRHGA